MATNTDGQITYRTRSMAYLDNTMYKDIKKGNQGVGKNLFYSDELFDEVRPGFNAIGKLVQVMTNLSMNGDIKIVNDLNENVTKICNHNKINSKKTDWIKELLLGKRMYIETIVNEVDSSLTDWIMHDSDRVEFVKDFKGDLFQVKIKTTEYEYEPKTDTVAEKEYTKTYTKLKEGTVKALLVDADGKKVTDETLNLTKLPVVQLETEYDMTRALQSIDDYNLINAYINSIFSNSEPLLHAEGVRGLSQDENDSISNDKYKTRKVIVSGYDTKLSMVELKGSSVAVMIQKQETIIGSLIDNYPEYGMSKVLSGSNISTDSMKLRMTEILAKVNNLRLAYMDGITDLLEVSSELLGVELLGTIELPEVFTDDKMTRLLAIEKAQELGKLSDESAMVMLSDLFLDGSVDNEVKRIMEESSSKEILKVKEMDGVTTNTEIADGDQ